MQNHLSSCLFRNYFKCRLFYPPHRSEISGYRNAHCITSAMCNSLQNYKRKVFYPLCLNNLKKIPSELFNSAKAEPHRHRKYHCRTSARYFISCVIKISDFQRLSPLFPPMILSCRYRSETLLLYHPNVLYFTIFLYLNNLNLLFEYFVLRMTGILYISPVIHAKIHKINEQNI